MVTYRNILPSATVERVADEYLDEVRRTWVTDYRRDHAEADWWAEGIWSIEHAVETQELVFRMADQLPPGDLPQARAGRVMIVIHDVPSLDQMRAHGFDPIVFDGADPAAFAWAIFELSNRINASITHLGCDAIRLLRQFRWESASGRQRVEILWRRGRRRSAPALGVSSSGDHRRVPALSGRGLGVRFGPPRPKDVA